MAHGGRSCVLRFVTGSDRADKDKMLLAIYMRRQLRPRTTTPPAPTPSRESPPTWIPELRDWIPELHDEPPEMKFQQEVVDTVRGTKKSPRPVRAAGSPDNSPS